MVEFACSELKTCKGLLSMYESAAHRLDRHRRDASALRLWVQQASPDAFKDALSGPLKTLEGRVGPAPDEGLITQ